MSNALFVAWRSNDPTNGRWGPVGKLEHAPDGFRFRYTHRAQSLEGFSPFDEMPELDGVYESAALFPLFANRLLAPSRPEYEAYLTWSGFDPKDPPDPIAILGVTEVLRATDSLELFPCPVQDAGGRYVNKFFMHAVRYVPLAARERIDRLLPGETLGFMLDISNVHDRNAVAVRTCDVEDRFMIGYVPRYLAREVRQICSTREPGRIELGVERVNPGAPLQQRLLCRMTARWPHGFRPCADEGFQPIASLLPAVAT